MTGIGKIDRAKFLERTTSKLMSRPAHVLQRADYPKVNESIIAIARKNPDAVAIQQGSMSFTYGELVRTAENVKKHLNDSSIRQGQRVAIYGQAGFGFACSMLGVIDAGAVAVPIDSRLPGERIRHYVKDSLANFVINLDGKNFSESFPEMSISSIHIRDDGSISRAEVASEGVRGYEDEFHGGSAYIHYTSGSTGAPKGIIGSHRGLSHFVRWQQECFDIRPSDRVANITGISFDVVLRELFTTLTSGATLLIPPMGSTVEEVWKWLDDQGVTVMHMVPSRLTQWLQHVDDKVSLNQLRYMFMAGEALRSNLVEMIRSKFGCEIVNLYGPSETTLAKLYYQVPDSDLISRGVQPLGKPIPGVQAFILSEDGSLCDIGHTGEMVIRTPYRSLGYVNPARNDPAFIRNPYTDDTDDLLYRTGDWGYSSDDGLIHFSGRRDDQVKIWGMRIELGEIKSLLLAHESVGQCHVAALDNPNEGKRLVAWMVPENDRKASERELSSYLMDRLPATAIPAEFIFLDTMPLNLNGKIDRKKLESHVGSGRFAQQSNGNKRPVSMFERKLADIWKPLLRMEEPAVDDNFFLSGGDSLQALLLIVEIQTCFGVTLKVRDLIEYPTIKGLARLISPEGSVAHSTSEDSRMVKLREHGSRPPLFIVPGGFGGENELLIFSGLITYLDEARPVYGLKASIEDWADPYEHSFSGVILQRFRRSEKVRSTARIYIREIKKVQRTGPYYLCGECISGVLAYEVAQQLIASGDEVGGLYLLECHQPFPSRRKWIREKGYIQLTENHGRAVANDRYPYYQGLLSYKPKCYTGDMHLIVTDDGTDLHGEDFGWKKYITGNLEIHRVPGDHQSYLRKHSRATAEVINQLLNSSFGDPEAEV